MSNVIKIRNTSANICRLFEDLLEKNNITIPDEDRSGNPEEARIYGMEYVELEDNITATIAKLIDTVKNNPNAQINSTEH